MNRCRIHRGSVWRLALVLLLGAGWRGALFAEEPRSDDLLFTGPLQHFVIRLNRTRGGAQGGRAEMEARVEVGTNVFEEVRLHLKGSGSYRALRYRPSLTLKFPQGNPCFGLSKLHLNNSVHDPSRLNEVLGSELHRQAGVPTTRATPVRVTLDGRDLGVYVLKEGFDRRFLGRNFPDAGGNLYDPHWGEDINQDLECDSGPAHSRKQTGATGGDDGTGRGASQSDRTRLLRATLSPVERRIAALGTVLDVERFLTTMALQIMTDDWDGYVRHHNNYRLYHEPSTDRFVFMPHGMDQLFGAPRGALQWPEWGGLVARSLFEAPGFPDRLKARMADLQRGAFSETNVLALIERTEARLQAGLEGAPERDREFYHRQAAALANRVRERFRVLREGPAEPLSLAPGRAHVLTGWVASAETPETELAAGELPDGTAVYSIQARSPATYGSWRTRMVLPAGQYRFEGTAWIEGVVRNQEGRDPGVGLRVVPARRGSGISGTAAATPLSHAFRLEATTEVVFVAEMSAHAGLVQFGRDSLRVVRTGGAGARE